MEVKRCRAIDKGMALSNKNGRRRLTHIHFPQEKEKRGRKTGKGQEVQTSDYFCEHKASVLSCPTIFGSRQTATINAVHLFKIQKGNCNIVRMGINDNAVIQEYFCE